MEKKTIGIMGGMGPLATADLYRKIVLMTDADRDNDHIRVYIDSNAAVPDRTAAILHGGADPFPYLKDSLNKLVSIGADCLMMPCNTAHYYLPRLRSLTEVPFISMLEAAARACKERYPGRKAAILATDGTVQSGLYQNALEAEGVEYLLPDAGEQAAVMRVIYEGVKAGKPPAAYRKDWETLTRSLADRGAEVFLLGCTELPIAAQDSTLPAPAVDPTSELAAAAIRFCGYNVRPY